MSQALGAFGRVVRCDRFYPVLRRGSPTPSGFEDEGYECRVVAVPTALVLFSLGGRRGVVTGVRSEVLRTVAHSVSYADIDEELSSRGVTYNVHDALAWCAVLVEVVKLRDMLFTVTGISQRTEPVEEYVT